MVSFYSSDIVSCAMVSLRSQTLNIVSRNVLIPGIPSPFVIVLKLWSLLLGPGAVPAGTTLSNREKLALKEQIDSLEQNLSKQIKEKESLFKTFSVFKNESKEKENKYMENEIDLEKKIKELDNIICKVGQSAQTVHMLTKPQAFYDNTHKQALGKEIVENVVHIPSTTTIAPGMFKLDLVPLLPRLLQNKEVHINYLRNTQEQANILPEIELLVYAQDTCPNATTLDSKKVVVTPMNNVKKVRLAEPLTSSSNIKQVESSNTSDSNTPVLSSTGVKCSTSICGSKPPGNKKNNRISQTLSRKKKNKVEAQPRKVNNMNRVVKPVCDVDVKQSLSNANSDILCATYNRSMFDGVMINVVQIVLWNDQIARIMSSGPGLQGMTPATSSTGLVSEAAAPRAEVLADSPVSTSIDQDAPSTSILSSQEQEQSPIISQAFEESPKTLTFHDDPLNES
ncbi:hypothetical protein Tco_0939081 [Tanacetum coccineum]|uniref:Uncharacterized protein n=1 Tax=Tanacetum coccineum TaxID=301880 RepID=A0ABQ5DJ15_9ASTR